jgi:twitching motility protein PilT
MSEEAKPQSSMNMHQFLKIMVERGGSDLHITIGTKPQIRIDGDLTPLEDFQVLSPVDTKMLCYSILTESQKQKFEEENELDFSFGIKGLSRFRGNLFMQRGSVAGVFRGIPYRIMTFDELGLPPVVAEMADKTKGLILVTGATGSGKSTTLATIVDKINRERKEHIITVEDPIEFLHPHKSCLVNQREIGADTKNFQFALKHILRQDPDVVLVGELRDIETIEAALTIAETGHLCLATLHTNGAVQTINRVVDVFPPHQQPQVRAQLSFVLEGILCQQLLPKVGGKGRVMSMEILVPNPAIRNLIREDKLHQVYSQMQMGQTKSGMQTMNQSLAALVQKRLVNMDDATVYSPDPEELRQLLTGGLGLKPAQPPVRR